MAGSNPFTEMLQLMHETSPTPSGIELGEVVSANCIKIGELQLTREDYLLNSYLQEKPFNTGDTVAIYPINNGQKYIVLCRVV